MTADGPLYGKYIVQRTDGRDSPGEKHGGCDYFVLDISHDPFARDALSAYAEACHRTHPDLASSLRQKLIDADEGTPAAACTEEGDEETCTCGHPWSAHGHDDMAQGCFECRCGHFAAAAAARTEERT